jgi:photosystem II stability/assembly factor-like uncharacterized protein
MRMPSPVRLLLLALLLAGCAGPAAGPVTSGTGATTTITGPAPTPAPKAPATQPDADPSTAVRVIATGRVEAGGGAGCLLLASDRGRTWLLVGGDRAVLAAGARVRVVGEPVPDRAGGCRQGEPLRVRIATPAG